MSATTDLFSVCDDNGNEVPVGEQGQLWIKFAGNTTDPTWATTFGEPERSVELATRPIRLNPNFPVWASSSFARLFFHTDRYQDTLHVLDRQSPDNYTTWRWAARAGTFAAVGRSEQAELTVQQAVERFPDIGIEGVIDDPGLSSAEQVAAPPDRTHTTP